MGNQGAAAHSAACDTTRQLPEAAPNVRAPTVDLNRFSGGVYPLAGHTRVRQGHGDSLLFGFPIGPLLLAVGFAVRPTLGGRSCGLTLAASSPTRRSPVRIRPLLRVGKNRRELRNLLVHEAAVVRLDHRIVGLPQGARDRLVLYPKGEHQILRPLPTLLDPGQYGPSVDTDCLVHLPRHDVEANDLSVREASPFTPVLTRHPIVQHVRYCALLYTELPRMLALCRLVVQGPDRQGAALWALVPPRSGQIGSGSPERPAAGGLYRHEPCQAHEQIPAHSCTSGWRLAWLRFIFDGLTMLHL